MVEYGEGAHITSMTLMALALLLLVIAFEKRRPLWWLPAGLALPTVVLSNWLGGATLAIAVVMWLLVMPGGTRWTDWLNRSQ